MISSSQVEWHGLISKKGRNIDDADSGEIREGHSDYLITEGGINYKEWFRFPSFLEQAAEANELNNGR